MYKKKSCKCDLMFVINPWAYSMGLSFSPLWINELIWNWHTCFLKFLFFISKKVISFTESHPYEQLLRRLYGVPSNVKFESFEVIHNLIYTTLFHSLDGAFYTSIIHLILLSFEYIWNANKTSNICNRPFNKIWSANTHEKHKGVFQTNLTVTGKLHTKQTWVSNTPMVLIPQSSHYNQV